MSLISVKTDAIEDHADLWRAPSYPYRWVIWNTAEGPTVFDRDINCPVYVDDEATRREVLRRMRAAGVPESDDYPGRPCA